MREPQRRIIIIGDHKVCSVLSVGPLQNGDLVRTENAIRDWITDRRVEPLTHLGLMAGVRIGFDIDAGVDEVADALQAGLGHIFTRWFRAGEMNVDTLVAIGEP